MQIDPKIPFWLGVWTSILMVIAKGTVKLTGVPADYVPIITDWSGNFAILNGIILTAMTGFSSSNAGPMVNASVPPAAKSAIAFLALLGASLLVRLAVVIVVVCCLFSFLAPAAFAQSRKAAVSVTPQSVAEQIQKISVPDLQYAIKLAGAVNTQQSKVRLQCYQAILAAVNPTAGADLGPMPSPPRLVTSVEQFAELVDTLQPTSPVFINCAGAAQLANLSVLGFVNAVVTGAAGIIAVVPKIP